MEINALKAQIKSGEFDKYYIFYGEEHQVIKIYIDMMAKKMDAKISYIEDLGSVFAKISQKSLLKSRNLYIILDDKEFLTSEKAWSAVNKIKDDTIIFYYTTTDKRMKFWKHFADKAVEFQRLDERVLIKYIQKKISLSEKNCKRLIEVCENDYSRILLEIDKIKRYGEANVTLIRHIEDNAFEMLLNDGTIYQPPHDAIFDFTNAFLDRDVISAYQLLNESKDIGEASLTILSVLYNNVKTMFQIQSSNNYKDLKLNGWIVKNLLPYKNRYSNGELVKCMKLIRQSEKGIKTGEIPDDVAVDRILVEVM